MGKYFGTDGARGCASDTLTPGMVVRIGQYLGWYYGKDCHMRILTGKDTRLPSDIFEMGLAAGAISCGAGVYLPGVHPAPAVSRLTQKEHFGCGVMVSANHNPFHDNGIELFNGNGCKVNPEIEVEVEKYIDNEVSVEVIHNEKIRSMAGWEEGLKLCGSWLKEIVPVDFSGMGIPLDLANGGVISCATETLSELGTIVEVIHSMPNGTNINTKCGSIHPEELQGMMKEGNYHVGFAFGGGVDRLTAVDKDGNLIDGDHMVYICRYYVYSRGILHDGVVMTMVVSSPGLYRALEAKGLEYRQTAVDGKYVFEYMKEHDYSIDGEQSGHVIFHTHVNAGDGLLTAMKLLEIMVDTKKSLKELCADLSIYPQLLINTPAHGRHVALGDKELPVAVDTVARELGDEERILVRPSGAEPLVRVIVETKTNALCVEYVNRIADFIKEKGL